MALKPEKFPDWATEEEVDPVSGQVNRVEPPDFRKVSGWTRREIPPRQWLNWLTWKTARWIRWAEDGLEGLQYATEAEAQAGTAEDRVIAPARFGDNSLTTNGYQVMPGGLIFQWFEYDPGTLTNNVEFTAPFPISFPNAALQVILSDTAGSISSTDSTEGMSVTSFTATSVTVFSDWQNFPTPNGSSVVRFLAIGH